MDLLQHEQMQSQIFLMIIYILLALVALWLCHIIRKFFIKPYTRMLKYKEYNGAIWIPFYPIMGAFIYSSRAFEKTGDENYDSKRSFETYPNARFFIFNVFDKCSLLLVDPSLLQQFFQKQENYQKEERFIENKVRFIGRGVAFSQGHEWSKKRKIMGGIFHFSFYNKFIPKIVDIVERQITKIRGHNQQYFQAQQLSALISGDTIIKTFFGIAFEDKIQDQPLSVWLGQLLADSVTQQRSFRYFAFGLKMLEMGLFKEDRSVNRRIQLFKKIAKESIEKKLGEIQHEEGTVLNAIVKKNLLHCQQGYTIDELISQFMIFYVAGSDTTSHLMAMCFYYLALYQKYQSALRQQISQTNILQHLDFRNISNMKFLDAFVKETFRHYNFMTSTFPRVCIKKHQLGELTVNEGDLVMPGWASNMYNQKYFPNPQNFDPERWNSIDEKHLDFIFTPFSIGARSCLGQHFALLQTKIVLIKIVSAFRLKLRPGYEHLLKTNSLYGPVNPIMIDLKDV